MKPELIITQHPESGFDSVLVTQSNELAFPWRPTVWDAILEVSPVLAKHPECRAGFVTTIIRREEA